MNQVTCRSGLKIHLTGLKKVPFSHPGQVDFPAEQVTFHCHLPNGKGQVICPQN